VLVDDFAVTATYYFMEYALRSALRIDDFPNSRTVARNSGRRFSVRDVLLSAIGVTDYLVRP
jgi:hypothetical protein